MRDFHTYLEALKFAQNRQAMQKHPYVQDASVGVEVEFTCCAAPFDDMKPEWLMWALKGKDFEQEYIDTYQHNDPDYEPDDYDFEEYIRLNKEAAWQALWQSIENYDFRPEEDEEYSEAMIRYWSGFFMEIIRKSGFNGIYGSHAYGTSWAIGQDGKDSELNVPLIELRSGIMSQKDMPKLLKVFEGVAELVKKNKRVLLAKGNTGFHIHVSNPRTAGKNGYWDIFARLASASDVDEDWIWDTSAPHDRSFERHAALNKPQNYTTGTEARNGGHDQIMSILYRLQRSKYDENPLWISNEELNKWVQSNLGRNMGVNVTSEHPTVEYRYFSSQLVVDNPQRALETVEYFIHNTAQLTNKDRIQFESSDGNRVVLTRFPQDMVRIDFIKQKDLRVAGEDEYGNERLKLPRIPRAGRTTTDLTDFSHDPQERPSWMPFSQWIKGVTGNRRNDLLDYARRRKPQ